MSTEAKPAPDLPKRSPQPVEPLLNLREIGELLVRHYGLKNGLFDVLVEYQMGAGPVGPNKDDLAPGIMAAVTRLGLVPAASPGPRTIDAAKLSEEPAATGAKVRRSPKAK